MRRIVGIGFAGLGVLLVVARFIVPGGKPLLGTGIFAIFLGGIVFGLSFIRSSEAAADAPPPLSPGERILGVFYEPARVFQNLRNYPRWFAAFLVIAVFAGIYHVAFTQRLGGEQIAIAEIEKVIDSGWIPADKQAEVRQQAIDEARSPISRVVKPLSQAGVIFLFMLVLAGLYLLLVMIFGGRLNFLQALSVATYASLPTIAIQNVLGLILLYIKSPDDIDPIKGQRGLVHADLSLLFSPVDHIYLYAIGGMIGIFTLYGLWLLTIGLRNTGEKVSAGTAWGIGLTVWFIGLLLVLGGAALFPSFVR